jgi:hypothetical protein
MEGGIVAYCKVISQNLHGGAKENHVAPDEVYPVYRAISEWVCVRYNFRALQLLQSSKH